MVCIKDDEDLQDALNVRRIVVDWQFKMASEPENATIIKKHVDIKNEVVLGNAIQGAIYSPTDQTTSQALAATYLPGSLIKSDDPT
ncbi:hypothetical protein HK100_010819, partial [Physocladia obscura]